MGTTTTPESSRFHIPKPPQLHPIPPALALRDIVNVSSHLYESHYPPVQLWHPLKAPQTPERNLYHTHHRLRLDSTEEQTLPPPRHPFHTRALPATPPATMCPSKALRRVCQ